MAGAAQVKRPQDNERAAEMAAVDRDRSFPNVRPRHAATLILLDHSASTPKVLMGKRHHGHRFMPGKFVFPGGRMEASDRQMASLSELHPKVLAKLQAKRVRQSESRPRTLALTAIRETFEETGLLLGTRADLGKAKVPAGQWRDFTAHGVMPDLAQVHFIARAITPPRRPKRFDTSFFCLDATAIAHKIDGVIGPETELTELVWVPLTEAQKLDLPHITSVVLRELDDRLAAGMGHDLPVPFYFERKREWFREEL